jgi:hypothetical protein
MRSSTSRFNITEVHTFALLGAADSPTLLYSISASEPLPQKITLYMKRRQKLLMLTGQSSGSPALTPAPGLQLQGAKEISRGACLSPARAGIPPKRMIPAFNLQLAQSWLLANVSFQENAMAISLQGLANREVPQLYLTYPPDWVYSYTPMVREFYTSEHGFAFTNLTSTMDAVRRFVPLTK